MNDLEKKKPRRWRLRRILAALATILLLAGAVGALWLRSLLLSGLPQVKGTIAVPGLGAEVEVLRDRYGVPHIFAQSEADLFFAMGFVHAQDRLWQMDLLRRTAEGRLAEIFGDLPMGGSSLLEQDKTHRVLGFLNSAKRDYENMDPELKPVFERYCRGVNAYIEIHENRLPFEFRLLGYKPEPWTPVNLLAQSRFLSFGLSGNYRSELIRAMLDDKMGRVHAEELFPRHSDPGPYIIPSAPPARSLEHPLAAEGAALDFKPALRLFRSVRDPKGSGPVGLDHGASNSWALSGRLTASGGAVLSNDPHLPHMLPSLFYQMHLVAPGIDVIGVSFPGAPFIVLGHNRRTAWSATTTYADTQDLFVLETDPGRPGRYLHNGVWKRFDRRIEIIRIKGGDHVELPVDSSVHGPILNAVHDELKGSPPVALAWPGHGGTRDGIVYYRAMKAESIDDFIEGAKLNEVPVQNWVFADADGRIGFFPSGRYPRRRPGHSGLRPVSGSGEFDWQGWVDADKIPLVTDPESGYIVTANNQVMAYPDEPFIITNENAPYYRARRIMDLIKAAPEDKQCLRAYYGTPENLAPCGAAVRLLQSLWPEALPAFPGFDINYMLAMQSDTHSNQGERLAPYFINAAQGFDDLDPLVEHLRQWDYRTDPQSLGAALFYKAYQRTWHNALEDELGSELLQALMEHRPAYPNFDSMIEHGSSLFNNINTPETEDRDQALRQSLAEAAEELESLIGPDPDTWTWGRVHTVAFEHAMGRRKPLDRLLNAGVFPSPGAVDVVFASHMDMTADEFPSRGGAAFRHVVDMSDPARLAGMSIDTGQAGHFRSPHYRDQLRLRLDCVSAPMHMDRSEIEADLLGRLVLTPPR